ncbi:MAG: c-type cytochrome biogenesis protein CcmI, partial [Paracoccaceae bacterium]
PDMPDLPIAQRIAEADAAMAARPDQATALQRLGTAPDPARIADLRADLAAQSDPQTLRTSYRAQLGSGDTLAALVTIERLLALPDAATAADHADQALALMIQAQGYISPEAEVSLRQALSMDMSNEMARYLVGEMFVQGQRYDQAFRFWRPLAENGNPQAPWTGLIRDQINDIAWLAGESYQLPDAQPGPSAADMAGAADMSDADRQEMIEGMVQQRQDRLAAEGGSAEDWVMLINALGVLGRTDEAQTAYDSAKAAHAADAAAMATLTAAATAAGLTP